MWVVLSRRRLCKLKEFPVYLLHAYDYCPEDPMICLCLAMASLGRAMQRQADNRQHLMAQVCIGDHYFHDSKPVLPGLGIFVSLSGAPEGDLQSRG
jgi:hypothetical protein